MLTVHVVRTQPSRCVTDMTGKAKQCRTVCDMYPSVSPTREVVDQPAVDCANQGVAFVHRGFDLGNVLVEPHHFDATEVCAEGQASDGPQMVCSVLICELVHQLAACMCV